MDELLGEFIAETRETLEPLASEIVAWEIAPDDRAQARFSIFRFVHTVKGSCGFLDLPRLERLSHAAEGALAEVREGTRRPDKKLVTGVLLHHRSHRRIGRGAGRRRFPIPRAATRRLSSRSSRATNPTRYCLPASPHAQHSNRKRRRKAPARSIRLPVETARPDDGGRVRHGARAQRAVATGCASAPATAACRHRVRAPVDLRRRDARGDHADADAAHRRPVFRAAADGARPLHRARQECACWPIDGGDVELDREMIEMIRDPLTHIVRNAIDHGIELPADRQACRQAGVRARCASMARQSGNQISDRGRRRRSRHRRRAARPKGDRRRADHYPRARRRR